MNINQSLIGTNQFPEDRPLSKDDALKREQILCESCSIPPDLVPIPIDRDLVTSRTIATLKEKIYNIPQSIFIVHSETGYAYVGRKLLSMLHRNNRITALHCSQITAAMLLGILKEHSLSERSATVRYYPFLPAEKLEAFANLRANRMIDIYYPYQHRDFVTGAEKSSPITGWRLQRNKIAALGHGEEHFRRHVIHRLQPFIQAGHKVYDPACSTGQFLHEVKAAYPNIHTIGHDLSAEMVQYAAAHVDESACCDARDSPLATNSVDVLLLRFLNDEVVRRSDCLPILKVLLSKLKPNGIVFCFGHTPVLIEREQFLELGLSILECTGVNDQYDSVFQCYFMRKN